MADTFPPTEAAELSTCGEEANTQPGEDMEEEDGDFTVQLGTTYSCRRADGTYLDAEVVKMRTNKRAKREEYMVRYVGLTRRQTEWVDKSRLVLLKPQEDEDAEEGSDQEMSEKGQTPQSEKPDEDEPEPKKVKVESDEPAVGSSVVAPADFTEELTCLLCGKLYEDPVLVECGHNFCRRCVAEAWGDQDTFTCPDCKEVITEKTYTANRAMANLVKKAAGVAGPIIPFKNCDDHEEQVKFFCKDDGTLSCVICQDSLKHAGHSFLPINDAVVVYRGLLSGLINPLEEALTKTDELAVLYRENIEQHESKMTEARQQVASEFEKLYSFLKEQKGYLLEQLQNQGQSCLKQMEVNGARLAKNRDNLQESVAAASEKAEDTNAYSFLPGVKQLLKKLKEQKKAALSSKNALNDQEFCHGTFNGPLQYIFWRQMKSLIGPIPECDELPLGNEEEATEKMDTSVDPSKDADMKSEKQQKSEESDDDDDEVAAQGPDIPIEDFSDLKVLKEIWIVGDGYVSAAGRQAAKGPYADNLLFPKSVCNVRWLSNTKAWPGLLPKLKKEAETHKKPHVLFIHIGSYELGYRSFDSLNGSVPRDLDDVLRLFRGVDIILSPVLPRKEWLRSSVEHQRNAFNATLRRYAGRHRFQVVKHDDLEAALFSRMEQGGDSLLNESECDVFLKNLREAVIKELKGRRRPAEKALEQEKGGAMHVGNTPGKTVEPVRKGEQPQSPVERGVMSRHPLYSKEQQSIWIIGNAYIFKAFGHVGKRPYGPHLGFKPYNWNLRWLGRTMRWHRMLPELQKSIGTQGMPGALFLHLGSDDLELISYEALVSDMRSCLGQLTQMYPKMKVVLSSVLPKAEWMGSHVDEWRKMFNTRLDRYADRHGFVMVKHDALEQRLAARFRRDGNSTLTVEENELFVSNIRDSLLKTISKILQPLPENSKKQERKSVPSRDARTEKDGREGTSTKPVQSSDEKKRQRTPSSAEKDSEADLTESEQLDTSMEIEESPQSSDLSPDQKLIVIAGNALISKAIGHAENASFGMNLGFEENKWTVRWIGKIMKWTNLMPALKKYRGTNASAVFLYLGSNDLGPTGFSTFFWEARHTVGRLAKQFPKAQIILSSILPKAEWLENTMETNRKRANEELTTFASKQGYEFVGHEELEEKLITRFKGDPNSLLSDGDIEEFVKNIKDSLEKAVQKGDRIPVEKPPQQDEDLDEEADLSSELENAESDQQEFEEPPIDPENLPEHKIWIVGNADIRAIHMHALNSSWGQNLGLEKRNWTLHWLGKTMLWTELLPKMRDTSHILGAPSAVFVNLGRSDLGQCRIKKLIGDVRSYLGQLSMNYPKTQFVISPVLSRAEWLDKPLEGCRKKFNSSIAEYARKCGYDVVSHDKLEKMRLARFKKGNSDCALSPNEKEVFMKTLKIALLKAMLKDHNAAAGIPFMPPGRREPEEVVLSSGATFYFVPDTDQRRPVGGEEEKETKPYKGRMGIYSKKRSPERDESDQSDSRSDSDQSDSESDREDQEKTDREDGEKTNLDNQERADQANLEKTDQKETEHDKETGTERGSTIQEEAEQDKERMDIDERKADIQEGPEQDVEMTGTKRGAAVQDEERRDVEKDSDERRPAVREEAGQDEEKMECDPPATLLRNEVTPDQPEQPPVDSDAAVQEKSGPKQVWIIGSSFVCRAKQHAHSKPSWHNLGFDEQNLSVHWMGCIGMRWEDLAEEVDKAKRELGVPSVIVIHLGGNDMGRMPYKQFFKAVKYDFRRFGRQFRKTQVIYSTILPRAEWLMTPVEQVRMKFNQCIVKCTWSLGFHVLTHNNIEEKAKARFKTGHGNDLSDVEYHLLLTSIKDSVQKVLGVAAS